VYAFSGQSAATTPTPSESSLLTPSLSPSTSEQATSSSSTRQTGSFPAEIIYPVIAIIAVIVITAVAITLRKRKH
jgi:hypothetical protein